ncbi:DUF4297 domain-containing protein [Paenibacillus cellulositrophicus]|uniref:DUF4297 domain-containing protein n=1 Tax=Paenibacillus cellulositrophicus TaxID=562959 RepID=UPI003F818FE1
MELKKLITENKPRETSGSRSSNRFGFQQDWAICKLIELHEKQDDYLLILDYHDDIVILDSETEPNQMEFYQLKTKVPGNWKINDLTKQKKGSNGPLSSIIGKLYSCKVSFPSHTATLNFVSNARLDVELRNKADNSVNKNVISFRDIESKKLQDIITKVRTEFELNDEPVFIDLMFYHVTDLNINDREPYVIGKLSEFLEKINPHGKFKMSLIYKSIFDEIKRKNNYEWAINEFEEIIKHKSISKSYFQNILNQFDIENNCESMWDYTHALLVNEKVPPNVYMGLKNAWRCVEIERMKPNNQYYREIRENAASIISAIPPETVSDLYSNLIEPAYKQFTLSNKTIYDEWFIKVTLLMEFYKI